MKDKIKIIKDKKKEIFRFILVLLIFRFSFIFKYIPILIFGTNIKKYTPFQKSITNTFVYLALALILVFIYRKELKKDLKLFIKNFKKYLPISFEYWFIGIAIMISTNLLLMFLLPEQSVTNESIVDGLIKNMPISMLIVAGILAPISEELAYRKSFMDLFDNKWICAFLSALVFGIIHVIGYIEHPLHILTLIPYGSLGFMFVLMNKKCNNIFPSIMMHSFHNIMLVLLQIFLV